MDAGLLFIRDEVSLIYRVAVSHDFPVPQADSIVFAFNEGVPGWIVAHHQPLIIDDARVDGRVHPTVVGAGVLSVLAVPLVSHGRIVDVLNLFSQWRVRAFDAAATQLAQVFADQTAVLDTIKASFQRLNLNVRGVDYRQISRWMTLDE